MNTYYPLYIQIAISSFRHPNLVFPINIVLPGSINEIFLFHFNYQLNRLYYHNSHLATIVEFLKLY